MENLKVGFVGSGFIARFMLRAMESVRDVELAGLVERSGAAALVGEARTAGMGEPRLYHDTYALAREVDVVAILVPNDRRLEIMRDIARAAADGGRVRAVWCDKPLGRTLAEARAMAKLAADANLMTAYFENQIHMPAIQKSRAQLAPQVATQGPLLLTRSAEEHGGPHNGWFWDPRRQGGGVLSDMGCHSIAVGWYLLTPPDKPLDFLVPETVTCEIACLKWGQPKYVEKLRRDYGLDFAAAPSEDYASGTVTFRNPETGGRVKAQFTDSWMFDRQGLRLSMEGLGAGYALNVDTLLSPLTLFIGDEAAAAVADREAALEKSAASRGLLAVPPNEAELYGYVDEIRDAVRAFRRGRSALLDFDYGVAITKLVMASYLAAEQGMTVHLHAADLESFVPLVAQGRGREVLFGR